ncbi:DUF6418 domain-containing protein [[Pasteurella] aerogenes]
MIKITVHFISIIFFSIFLVLNFYFSWVGLHNESIFLTGFLLFSFLCYLYFSFRTFFFISIKFVILLIWVCLSLFYIENGNFISEQRVFGAENFSFVRYFFYEFIFFTFAAIFFNYLIDKKRLVKFDNYSSFINLSHALFWFVFLGLLVVGFVKGFPLLSKVSRFHYWTGIEYARKLTYLTTIISFFYGVCYALTKRMYFLICCGCLIILLVLFSDKFSGPFSVIQYFMMGYYVLLNIKSNKDIGFSKKTIFIILPLLLLILVISVALGYMILSGASIEDLYDKIMQRAFGLQGHVWYGIDTLMKNGKEYIGPDLFFAQNDEPLKPAGLVYLMYQISDYNFVYAMRESGIRFTMGFPAIVIISFGYFYSIFVIAILGLILGAFFIYLYNKLMMLQFFRLLLALIFFNNIISNVFLMGEIYFVYNIISIFCIAFFIFDFFILQGKNIKVRR